MGSSARFGWTAIGIITLFVVVVALSDGAPLWAIVAFLAVAGASSWLAYFLWSRFTDEGQDKRFAMQEQLSLSPPDKADLKSRLRIRVYAAVAIGSLLTGLSGFLNPTDGAGEGLGISSFLLAAIFGFLAFHEYRKGQVEPDATLFGELKPAPIGSPRTTLIVIAIFVILLTIADVRLIVRAAEPNDVFIGAGQMVIWLPVFGYLAYREVRRMKASRTDQT
jgi:hypothetical protein